MDAVTATRLRNKSKISTPRWKDPSLVKMSCTAHTLAGWLAPAVTHALEPDTFQTVAAPDVIPSSAAERKRKFK